MSYVITAKTHYGYDVVLSKVLDNRYGSDYPVGSLCFAKKDSVSGGLSVVYSEDIPRAQSLLKDWQTENPGDHKDLCDFSVRSHEQ